MKPAFALSLSFEGISLLHRCAGGWRNAGEAALDAPDLATALSGLRGAASRLEPGPLFTKLIIPNEQIRYLSIDTGLVDAQARDRKVREALEGATPYAVSELAYDISVEGNTTHVAAVARETLAEAEQFAVEHEFGPLSFVAIPGRKPFLGEPFFGPTAFAKTTLPASDHVEADGIAVVVVGPAQFPVDGVVPVAAPAEQTASPQAEPEPPAPQQPEAAPAPAEEAVATFSSRRRRSGSDTPAPAPATPEPVAAQEPPAAAEIQTPAAPEPTPQPVLSTAPDAPVATAPLVARPEQAGAAPELAAPMRAPVPVPPLPADDPPQSRLSSLLRRRREKPAAAPAAAAPAPEPAKREVDVSGMPPKLAAAVLKTADPASGEQQETERMTVFGARQAQAAKSRPRFLGLILTAVLLLFLAGVAAWASIFLDDQFVRLFDRDQPTAVAATTPDTNDTAPAADPVVTRSAAPQTSSLAPAPESVSFALPTFAPPATGNDQALTTPIGPEQPVTLASLDPASAGLTDTDTAVLNALRAPRSPAGAQPDARGAQDPETRYAVTGIWSEAPPEPDTPSVISLDDLYIGSIDNRDLSQDAVALPEVASLQTDDPIGILSSPAAPDTRFEFDERGLVRATPEGTLTPDGILVYLGRPDVVPPPTPDRTVETPEADTLQDRLAGFRPRSRPDDLSEQAERGQLGGLTRTELATVRPKARPDTVKQQEEEADDTATAQAVAASVAPKKRPAGFTSRVRKQQADPANTQVAAIAPKTVTPKIPTSASVSRQATLNNAVDLRQVNLIGVYGTPSNRRALVRLPSGRYKKVQVGDSIDGGRVSVIGDSELLYQKGGRNLVLKIPSG